MSQQIRKIFSLGDIQYTLILLLSSVFFAIINYLDRFYTNDPIWINVGYWIAIVIAVLWGALNYISHIRMNNMYRKQNDIQEYVNLLAMSEEDKLELRTYLEDYVQDLIEQGQTREDATREAINQFKVKEFLTLSKNTMFFNLHAHYYLIGWSIVSIIACTLVWFFEMIVFPYPFITLTIESVFIAYGIGLFGMFFLYKLIDAMIYRKLGELF